MLAGKVQDSSLPVALGTVKPMNYAAPTEVSARLFVLLKREFIE